MRRCHYLTNCVNSTVAKINAMKDQVREITYKTFISHVDPAELVALFPYYTWGPGPRHGLRLKDDWSVAYYVSRYAGRHCY